MRKRTLGTTGLQVSEIGFGALEIGRDWADDCNPDPSHLTASEAAGVLNAALDSGINFIDTAPAYWFSEEFIGNAIAHRRGEYVLATKVGEQCDRSGSIYDYSAKATHAFIDQSLRRLRTDTIDLLQIHSASIEVLERGETLQAMEEARAAGKVRHIGMTGGVPQCIRALELGGYETVQFPYNLLDISAEERLFPLIRERGAGAIIMRGLAGGKLTAKFENLQNRELADAIAAFDRISDEDGLAALAVRFVLARPEVSSVILGTRRVSAIQENLKAAGTLLAPEILEKVIACSRAQTIRTW